MVQEELDHCANMNAYFSILHTVRLIWGSSHSGQMNRSLLQTKRQSNKYKQMYQNKEENLNTEAKSFKAQSGKTLHIQPLGLHQGSGEDPGVETCSPQAASLHYVT